MLAGLRLWHCVMAGAAGVATGARYTATSPGVALRVAAPVLLVTLSISLASRRAWAPASSWQLRPRSALGRFFIVHAWHARAMLRLVACCDHHVRWTLPYAHRVLLDVEENVDELDRRLARRSDGNAPTDAVMQVCLLLAQDVAVLALAGAVARTRSHVRPHVDFTPDDITAADACNALRALAGT